MIFYVVLKCVLCYELCEAVKVQPICKGHFFYPVMKLIV